tara:strand:+ start:913 stop:1128 length:216 start_codon:yes stop_codon:yes gene_type:complete
MALTTEDGTAAAETALCYKCYTKAENVAYAREMAAQSDDLDPNASFVDFGVDHPFPGLGGDNNALSCVIHD